MVIQYLRSANPQITFHNSCGEVAAGAYMFFYSSKNPTLKKSVYRKDQHGNFVPLPNPMQLDGSGSFVFNNIYYKIDPDDGGGALHDNIIAGDKESKNDKNVDSNKSNSKLNTNTSDDDGGALHDNIVAGDKESKNDKNVDSNKSNSKLNTNTSDDDGGALHDNIISGNEESKNDKNVGSNKSNSKSNTNTSDDGGGALYNNIIAEKENKNQLPLGATNELRSDKSTETPHDRANTCNNCPMNKRFYYPFDMATEEEGAFATPGDRYNLVLRTTADEKDNGNIIRVFENLPILTGGVSGGGGDIELNDFLPNIFGDGQFNFYVDIEQIGNLPRGQVKPGLDELPINGKFWYFSRKRVDDTGEYDDDFLYIDPFINVGILDGNPHYFLNFKCKQARNNTAYKRLFARFENVMQWSGKQLQLFFYMWTDDDHPVNITLKIMKNYGDGGSPYEEHEITRFVMHNKTPKKYGAYFQVPAKSDPTRNRYNYWDLVFELPTRNIFSIKATNFYLTATDQELPAESFKYPEINPRISAGDAFAGALAKNFYSLYDAYLPIIVTPYGLEFDRSHIGEIVQRTHKTKSPCELLCDGRAYEVYGFHKIIDPIVKKPAGIPYKRLYDIIGNTFGTSDDFVTATHSEDLDNCAKSSGVNISNKNEWKSYDWDLIIESNFATVGVTVPLIDISGMNYKLVIDEMNNGSKNASGFFSNGTYTFSGFSISLGNTLKRGNLPTKNWHMLRGVMYSYRKGTEYGTLDNSTIFIEELSNNNESFFKLVRNTSEAATYNTTKNEKNLTPGSFDNFQFKASFPINFTVNRDFSDIFNKFPKMTLYDDHKIAGYSAVPTGSSFKVTKEFSIRYYFVPIIDDDPHKSTSNPSYDTNQLRVWIKNYDNIASLVLRMRAALERRSMYTLNFAKTTTIEGGEYFVINGKKQKFVFWYSKGGVGEKPTIDSSIYVNIDVPKDSDRPTIAKLTQQRINSVYFQVPDYRGMFLRGFDGDSNSLKAPDGENYRKNFLSTDYSANNFFNDQNKRHIHKGGTSNSEYSVARDSEYNSQNSSTFSDYLWKGLLSRTPSKRYSLSYGGYIHSSGGTEARPISRDVYFYIRL